MCKKFHVIIHILIYSFCGLCVHVCRLSMRHMSLDFFLESWLCKITASPYKSASNPHGVEMNLKLCLESVRRREVWMCMKSTEVKILWDMNYLASFWWSTISSFTVTDKIFNKTRDVVGCCKALESPYGLASVWISRRWRVPDVEGCGMEDVSIPVYCSEMFSSV